MQISDLPATVLFGSLFILTMLSAYFSGSETAMIGLNRYRLKHSVNQGNRSARKAERLLKTPENLLGVILIGNNLVNNIAATVAAVIGLQLLGDTGLLLAPIILTVFFLVFAEVAPKTLAAQHPERFAFISVHVLDPLLRLLYPLVRGVGGTANLLLRWLIKDSDKSDEKLSMDELRTVLLERSRLPTRHQSMLLQVLELEKLCVDDIMVPRSEVYGIDLEDDANEIAAQIASSQHTRLPVFTGTLNQVEGIFHMRKTSRLPLTDTLTKKELKILCDAPYFVPEGTPLHVQLMNFQKKRERMALVVDEYGDVQGLVALEDILEEIVGEFTSDLASNFAEVFPQDDGSWIVDGKALVREVNRSLDWKLPIGGPRTVNGLVLEHLQLIPDANVSFELEGYRIETLQLGEHLVRSVRITPPHTP